MLYEMTLLIRLKGLLEHLIHSLRSEPALLMFVLLYSLPPLCLYKSTPNQTPDGLATKYCLFLLRPHFPNRVMFFASKHRHFLCTC